LPTQIAHGLIGASFAAALHPQPTKRAYAVPLLIGALVSTAPDLDFLLVIALGSKSWHRGFTHSIVFAFFVYLFLALVPGKRRFWETLAYGLAFGSHGILDCLTSKEGTGVELLWPFSSERLKLGWRGLSENPLGLPPTGLLKAAAFEFVLFTPLLIGALFLRKAIAPGLNSAGRRS
jgi:inner membrane protein